MSGDAAPASHRSFQLRRSTCSIPISPPQVMGILNVTPDSFSDGGTYLDAAAAIRRACEMVEEGAGIIDVGAESTRPGSHGVADDEQIARAIPVISGLRSANDQIAISIDTRSAVVARRAIDAGADMVNDTSALRDDEAMVAAVAKAGAAVVLMHRRGTPIDMQINGGPRYDDVIEEVLGFLVERRDFAIARGIDASRILIDPGLGFGKRVEDNLQILAQLERFASLRHPVVIGASRKRFIGAVTGVDEPHRRDAGSLACAVLAIRAGASIVRAHDVRATVEAVRVCESVRQSVAATPASI